MINDLEPQELTALVIETEESLKDGVVDEPPTNSSFATKVRNFIEKQDIEFAVDKAKKPFARVKINEHFEIFSVESQPFKDYLLEILENNFKTVIPVTTLDTALSSISSKARRSNTTKVVAVRVYFDTGVNKIYLDLCNNNWETIEIDSSGWRVCNDCPIWFQRFDDMDKIPKPCTVSNTVESLHKLKKFINYTTEDNFDLIVCWLLSNLLSDIGTPLLVLQGSQGVGKSLSSEFLRSIFDPAKQLKSTALAKKSADIIIQVSQSRVTVYDNLSSKALTPEISDLLCCIATNSASARRSLYTNSDLTIFKLGASLILNGIDELATRADLLDRSIIINLEPVSNRERETVLRTNFEQERAEITGALLNIISYSLAHIEDSNFKSNLFRFTDLGTIMDAASPALDWNPNHFKNIVEQNMKASNKSLAQSSYLVMGIVGILEEQSTLDGKPSHVLAKIKNYYNEIGETLPPKALPTPNTLKGQLKRHKKTLEQFNISYSSENARANSTIYRISKLDDD
ncbi:hypothetical protein ACI1TH_07155 [Lactococcus petauri]|uniref:hypothetical protein n=1 Tax=Lactococcus petauri TaxID=1940789 RepID=UPI003854D1C1